MMPSAGFKRYGTGVLEQSAGCSINLRTQLAAVRHAELKRTNRVPENLEVRRMKEQRDAIANAGSFDEIRRAAGLDTRPDTIQIFDGTDAEKLKGGSR
jgi:hypothetical protein